LKLLFDENLSETLVSHLILELPGSNHVSRAGLIGATDQMIWDFARNQGFTIVSKDNDFRQRAFLFGPPPKVVWLAVGNVGTMAVVNLMKQNKKELEDFESSAMEGLLVLP
jgi:predicted nuclease of predicted toxin-antitoxin system